MTRAPKPRIYRIRIEKNESVELYIRKTEFSCKVYSSVGNATADGMPDPSQKKINSGLAATMVLHGPLSICANVTKKTPKKA